MNMILQITQTLAETEVREAMITFTICLGLSGAIGFWWSLIYWNIEIRSIIKGSKETLGFIKEQEKFH